MVDRGKITDGASSIDKDGKIGNARLHEKLTEGVDDTKFCLETKRKMLAGGIRKEVMDRLIPEQE
jgi:hypothetical protein